MTVSVMCYFNNCLSFYQVLQRAFQKTLDPISQFVLHEAKLVYLNIVVTI